MVSLLALGVVAGFTVRSFWMMNGWFDMSANSLRWMLAASRILTYLPQTFCRPDDMYGPI